jgi:hypothetical protein
MCVPLGPVRPPRSQTLETIGKSFGVTRERIRKIEAKALGKLRVLAEAVAHPGVPTDKDGDLTFVVVDIVARPEPLPA